MHERILPRICTCVSLALALPACLDRNGGNIDTTIVDLTTGGSGTTGQSDTSTTFPEVMTTTMEPVDTDTSTGSSTGSSTTETVPPMCGDGNVDPDEECDHGAANADDAACTAACKWATCGDGHVHKDMEACDDGSANGDYGKCAADCSGAGPRCGDSVVQMEAGEYCDDTDPKWGCLKDCKPATSCLEIKQSWGAEATDGPYKIRRMSQDLTVWCDMDADGGGYTFLKHAATVPNVYYSAKDAEQVCSSQYGMRLMVPRSPAHLTALADIAASPVLASANDPEDKMPGDLQAYLGILGVYPVTPGVTCLNKPLNSTDCPEWAATQGPFWLTDTALDPTQPSASNCAGCSMSYTWTVDDMSLVGYEAFKANGIGATSTHFMCDIGDKLPM